ncbi:MAG TPA: TerC/Alx family metal homeostasis membrane protein [Actinomycetota bacterium]|uniref:Integral membrane protein TerC n=1 Tax=uncultured bacterium A1Q1_fos_160 TaxID=1256550 RepID=L7W0S2_9BACT|nr:integral membrane protein TerC [uncultured bacterium A1Q1_fos_160]MCB0901279.1 TerC/Alx family metal homeostasis membrane protein [Actinomycetota bacterium]MCB0921104.1 TerC/Alx family metal homeostasis membrane protein [Actinomycetota bacterium]HNE88031.1 TerC/Alx family metal homeostasis membrane protein [Actinomycetota bacterium]HNL51649.1 TerC/Alx family metal homeostasis membrane protein [Actinomycetota bacterium]
MTVPGWLWAATIALFLVLFTLDFWIVGRRPHVPKTPELLRWLGLFVGSAILFGLFLGWQFGGDIAVQFFSGWLTEYSLSVDNLFVFVLIMARFYVPRELQQYVLMWGIIIALVLRGIFIALGAAIIAQFSWVFYIFGIFLIITAIRLATHGEDDDEEYKENAVVRLVARLVPIAPDFHGTKMRMVLDGRRVFTPMLVVLIAIGTTDLLFAVDSIPAIFGLTQIPFLVFTANVFALMGLRQLFFLLGNLLDRLVFLGIGLAAVLGFIGVKLILEAMHENALPFLNNGEPFDVPVISNWLSLLVIIVILTITVIASLLHERYVEPADPSGKE